MRMKPGDRCSACCHCKARGVNRSWASCRLFREEGFHPLRPAPKRCIGAVTRKD